MQLIQWKEERKNTEHARFRMILIIWQCGKISSKVKEKTAERRDQTSNYKEESELQL